MPSEEQSYYRARAAEERDRAAQSDRPGIAQIHLDLAEKYDALSREAEHQITLRPGWDGSGLTQSA